MGRRLIPRPVFLIGCARSGTSILGEAIAAHPRVAYLFEVNSIWNELVPAKPDHRLERADATPEVARAIYQAFWKREGTSRGFARREKPKKHVIRIPFLAALFPEARFLHVMRDGA